MTFFSNTGKKQLSDLRIIFMGTPEFAVASLTALVAGGCSIVAVVTAPDKAAGRGMQLQQSAVKKYAIEMGIPVLQPEKLKDPLFLTALQSYRADIQVVVAFRMLPELVWDMPAGGTINLHGSLLPQYRGAAPINWAIINGETTTGVTTFKLQHAIDTGDILLQETIVIEEDETAGELHDKMKEIGAALLLKTMKGIVEDSLLASPQASKVNIVPSALQHAPKIFTATCKIDWHKPQFEVYNLIRGLSPYPGAFTFLDNKMLKIFISEKKAITDETAHLKPGEYITDKKTYLDFVCADGLLAITELQLEGKKKMTITDFLKGYRFN